MTTKLKSIVGASGQNLNAILFSDYVDALVLSAGTATPYTVPTGAKYLLLSSTDDFYVNSSGAAAVPSSDVTDGSGSELNPVLRAITTNTPILSFIAPSACTITISVFS